MVKGEEMPCEYIKRLNGKTDCPGIELSAFLNTIIQTSLGSVSKYREIPNAKEFLLRYLCNASKENPTVIKEKKGAEGTCIGTVTRVVTYENCPMRKFIELTQQATDG